MSRREPATAREPVLRIARSVYVQLAAVVLITAVLAGGTGVEHAAVQSAVVGSAALLTFAVHETGHAAAAWSCRLKVHAIVVRGLLEGATIRSLSPDGRVNAMVSIAGPLASAALGALGLAIAVGTTDPYGAGRALVVTNVYAVLSTLTLGPRSDGMRAWRAWREHVARRHRQPGRANVPRSGVPRP